MPTQKKEQYGNESISSLKGADRVRKRPAVIFGSDGLEGCQHAVFEILSNSIDEAREGYGSLIEVTVSKDHVITVEDFGRGIPLDYNPNEERYNWELIFCEMYAGGKYQNLTGENYEFSLGLNGLGACATQYSSTFMDVLVVRDGFEYTVHFEKGENVGGLQKTPTSRKKTGTKITFQPDLEVFTDINVPLEYFKDILKKQSVVNAGVRFQLKFEAPDPETGKYRYETYEYYYQEGIIDYIRELDGGEALTEPVYYETERKGRDREDKPEYKVKMQVAFNFHNKANLLEYYHNSSFLEHGGSPDKAVRAAFVKAFDNYLKANQKYNKNESKIQFQDVADCLVLVTNSFSTMTSYENQTKKAINNKFIQEAMTSFLLEKLEIYLIENKADAEKAAGQILVNKRSRETAEKARVNIKKKLTGTMDLMTRVKKFVDCRSKDPEKREIYIVEGDSALGSCKLGRDPDFQAIMPIRGKILNCLKADYDKIFKSDVIVDLLKVLGCGVEIASKHKDLQAFDLEKLKWGKVVICTDADVDGYQIRTLLLTMLYRLTPTLIEQGYVFIAESPLFEITHKDETYFAYNEKEKTDLLATLGDKCKIQRSKGLGENEPEMMWQTTMNPETRRLILVTPEEAQRTQEVFDLLLGDNLQGRKDYIAEEGHRFLDLSDLA